MSLKNSNSNCCVLGCTSRKGKNPELSFHRFPNKNEIFVKHINQLGVEEKIDRRIAWTHAIKAAKDITRSVRICSRHFVKTDFILPDAPAIRRRLKKIAVPSLHLPEESQERKTKGRKLLIKPSPSSSNNKSSGNHVVQQNPSSNEDKSTVTFSELRQSAIEALLLLSTSKCTILPESAKLH